MDRHRTGSRYSPGAASQRNSKPARKWPWPEIITALIVLLLLTGKGEDRLSSWWASMEMDGEASDLYYDLEWAKAKAIKKNIPVLLQVGSAEYSIFMDRNRNGKGEPDEVIRERKLDDEVRFWVPGGKTIPGVFATGADPANSTLTPENRKILSFDNQGAASADFAFYLAPRGKMDFAPDYLRAVVVFRAEGPIRIMKYQGTASPPWQ
ncbi:MAG: GspH/FimT family pseudopilin [Nitrospinaceae bacterium]